MLLLLKRHWGFEEESDTTIGLLCINGVHFCFTLEDKVRPEGIKVQSKTAIPTGEYTVIIDVSTRFKRLMPHVLAVPNFTGIRIHSGNTDEDTEGCILVGYTRAHDKVLESRRCFKDLFTMLNSAYLVGEPITLKVINEPL